MQGVHCRGGGGKLSQMKERSVAYSGLFRDQISLQCDMNVGFK